MWYRRALFYAQFGAVIVLPVWLLVGRGVLGADSGWDFLSYLLIAPTLAAVLGVVAVLTWARGGVRRQRAVSWLDAAVLTAWYLAIIAFGAAWTPALATGFAAAAVTLGVVAFWIAVWRLVAGIRRRARAAIDTLNAAAPPRPGGPVIRIERTRRDGQG